MHKPIVRAHYRSAVGSYYYIKQESVQTMLPSLHLKIPLFYYLILQSLLLTEEFSYAVKPGVTARTGSSGTLEAVRTQGQRM